MHGRRGLLCPREPRRDVHALRGPVEPQVDVVVVLAAPQRPRPDVGPRLGVGREPHVHERHDEARLGVDARRTADDVHRHPRDRAGAGQLGAGAEHEVGERVTRRDLDIDRTQPDEPPEGGGPRRIVAGVHRGDRAEAFRAGRRVRRRGHRCRQSRQEPRPGPTAGEGEGLGLVGVHDPGRETALHDALGRLVADGDGEGREEAVLLGEEVAPFRRGRGDGVGIGTPFPLGDTEVEVARRGEQSGGCARELLGVEPGQLVGDEHDRQAVDDRVVGGEEHGEPLGTVRVRRLHGREGVGRPGQWRGVLVEEVLQMLVHLVAAGALVLSDDPDVGGPHRRGHARQLAGVRVDGGVGAHRFVPVDPREHRSTERIDVQRARDVERRPEPGLLARRGMREGPTQMRLVDEGRGSIVPMPAGVLRGRRVRADAGNPLGDRAGGDRVVDQFGEFHG